MTPLIFSVSNALISTEVYFVTTVFLKFRYDEFLALTSVSDMHGAMFLRGLF